MKSSRPSSPWSIRWVCVLASFPSPRGAVLASLEFVVKFCAEALGGDDIGVGRGDCRADLVAKLFVLLVLQMGFFAEAGPVQIFVSNHVSDLLFLVMLCCSNYPNKLQNFSS